MLTDDDFMLTFVLFPDVPIPEIATVDQLKHTVTLSQLVDFSRLNKIQFNKGLPVLRYFNAKWRWFGHLVRMPPG